MQWADESDDMVPSEEGAQLREEAVAWVIRLHSDNVSPEGRKAFDAWHSQSPAHALMFQKVFNVWDSAELSTAAAVAAAEPLSFAAKSMFRHGWSILGVAVVACVIFLAIFAFHFGVLAPWLEDH